MSRPRELDCTIIRGGTSKAVFVRAGDLPSEADERDAVLLRLFGSPDARQIDGLGGADPLTSKCAIIGPSSDPAFDLEYRFAQVEIERASVDYHSICGNISSGLGHYALFHGLAGTQEKVLRLRVRVLNSPAAWLEIETPVEDGRGLSDGDFRVAGVPGTGAEIVLNLAGLAGARLGSTFPTGHRAEMLVVEGLGEIRVTLMDVGNPHVFVAAGSVGLTGTESAARIDGDPALLQRLEHIRSAAAHRMGLVTSPHLATLESASLPILGIMAPPADYATSSGQQIACGEMDVLGRLMFMQRAHKAYAGTSTACTGAALRVPGTIPFEAARPAEGDSATIRIGHPEGIIFTEASVATYGSQSIVTRATVSRTARILMNGRVYLGTY